MARHPNSKQKETKTMRLMRHGLYGLLLLGVIGIIALAALIFVFSRDVPDHRQLEAYYPATMTRLYAGDGSLLAEYAKEKRIYVPIDAMPKVLTRAFIAAEDRSFYTNAGIDVFGIIRAAYQNVWNALFSSSGHLVGASTITQQIAKNILLGNERTLSRKIKEAILAFRMSIAFSKDRILELYLNEIYLGSGSYGVAAAAMDYFNKSVDELTIEEAALLAALPKAPSNYDPRKNYQRARERRNWVIQGMLEEKYITEAEARFARSEPIRLRTREFTNTIDASYFSEEVRRWIEKKYGSDTLYEDGLVVRTTLDPHLQAIAEKAMYDGLIEYDRRHGFHGKITRINIDSDWAEALRQVPVPTGKGNWQLAVVLQVGDASLEIGLSGGSTGQIPLSALKWAQKSEDGFWSTKSQVLNEGDVVLVEPLKDKKNEYGLRQIPEINGALVAMDPHTGRVLALVGGGGIQSDHFNRATQAKRQPGSAFKPFAYLTALENGFTPAMLILDEPIEFETKKVKTPKPDPASNIQEGGEENFEASIMSALGTSQTPVREESEVEVWAPQNYSDDFYGPTTLRIGVENSRNVMTVRLGLTLGLDKILEVAKRFGIYQEPARNLSTVLGAEETTLMDVTNAYSMLVNGGKRVYPSLVERVQDRNGQTIFRRDERICPECNTRDEADVVSLTPPELPDDREQVIDTRIAYQMVSILEGVIKRGTGIRARRINKPLGGKTGTTNNAYDAWFIGFSPDLVVGVYCGFDQPKSLGERETGSSVSLPIFVQFMEEALKGKPSIPFRIPPDITLVRIDRKTGFLPSDETDPGDIILEAFLPGTEPTRSARRSESLPVINSLEAIKENPEWFDDLNLRDLPVTRGTGGIY